MNDLTFPQWVSKHNYEIKDGETPHEWINKIKSNLEKLKTDNPVFSVVIPAYNEEKTILQTLSSLSETNSKQPLEIIVVNNNSTDRTQDLLDLCGVRSYMETNQGVSFARDTGLKNARGKIILSADSDTIYPPDWVDFMAKPLENPAISCVYGIYSFIPDNNPRPVLAVYELLARFVWSLRPKKFVNVLGFNFAYRKEDGIKVGGFRHDLDRMKTEACEDGMMALSLSEIGKLHHVTHSKAKVWTSDRRIVYDGGLFKAFILRAAREIRRRIFKKKTMLVAKTK